MKIEFKKISSVPKSFSLQKGDLSFSGEVKRIDAKLFEIQSLLHGKISLICDRSGEEYQEQINENLVLFASNGIWDKQSQNKSDDFDVIEFFEGFIDFEYILQSEIDSIQMQYHIKEGD
ncbi:hypothetical protein LW138_06370 [Helicobacter sp. faydin-H17]|uniref:hypothetical protein n=1 Tax=Helicobacter kayseriensis TaxID=2905877 RepID=UPI001E4C2D2A|nr:hypothetical protein [Helicobacter kayseriensis]MCE3047695.1 hypothetical protein [Helicobacter kayseriensis]